MPKNANIIGWIAIILNAGAQLLLAPIIKSEMGAIGLGVWHLIFQTFAYLQLIDFGWSYGIIHEIALINWDQAPSSAGDLLKTIKRLLTAIGSVFSIAGIIAIFVIPHFVQIPGLYQRDFSFAILVLAAWGIPRYRYGMSLLLLRGQNRMTAFNSLGLIQGAGRPILGALMAFVHMGIIGITIGYITAEATARFIAYCFFSKVSFEGSSNRIILFRILKFGCAAGAINLSTLIAFYSSSFIVGWKLGVAQVAAYQSSIALPLLLMRMAIIPFTNRLPSMIYGFQSNSCSKIIADTIRSHALVLIVSGISLFGISMFNELFVTIWVGIELYAGNSFSLVFSIYLLLNIARHNGFMVWQSKNKLKAMTIAQLIEVPISILFSLVLINHLGLDGVIYAFILASLPSVIVSQLAFSNK